MNMVTCKLRGKEKGHGCIRCAKKPDAITVSLIIGLSLFLFLSLSWAEDKDFSYFPCPFKEDKDNGKWGYIDKTGRVVIKPQFYSADSFREGLAKVVIKNGKIGFIDSKGKMVIKPIFENIDDFHDGMARVHFIKYRNEQEEHKVGYINKNGVMVVPPTFEEASDFSEGLAQVCIKDKTRKCGYINKSGKLVIATDFDGGWDFSEGLAAVYVNRKCGYINKSGKFVIQPVFDEGWPFSEGLAAVSLDDGKKWGFIDKSGKIVIEPKIEGAFGKMHMAFSDGLFCADMGDSEGFIDKQGKLIIDTSVYDRVWDFQEGLAGVAMHGKGKDIAYVDGRGVPIYKDVIMYIDKTGKPAFEVQAEVVGGWLGPFSKDGVAKMCSSVGRASHEGCGFIDRQGRFTIEQKLRSGGY